MAITYGAYSQRARLGIDVSMSPSTVTKDTASVTLTWTVYLQSSYSSTPGYSGTYTLRRTGTGPTGNTSESIYTAGSTPQNLGSWTQTVSTSYSGSVSKTMSVDFSTAFFDGARPTHSRTFTVPKRPPQAPAAPSTPSASYVSDSQANVSWSRAGTAGDAGTIYESQRVRRSTDGGSFATVATVSATATAWTDSSVSANHSYVYQVQAVNVSGTATSGSSGAVNTTPAAPTTVTASREGDDIRVSWTDNAAAETGFSVYDNGTFVSPRAAANATSYLVPAPNPAVPHTYTVRAVTSNGGTDLFSAYSAPSNEVQLQSPPAAPTNLSPNGTARAVDEAVVLSWSHVPVDASAQAAYEIEHRPAGGTWTSLAGKVTSGTSSRTVAASTWPTGSREWRVRTWGSHPDPSPYSAAATIPLTTRPTATIAEPSSVHAEPSVTIEWAYYHASASAQSAWEARLLTAEGQTLAAGSGSGTSAAWTPSTVLENAEDYTAEVRVRESLGLWSEWADFPFSVAFPAPLPPLVEAAWDDLGGYVEVHLSAQDDGIAPATASLSLARSLDGGSTWEPVASSLDLDAYVQDYEAPSAGLVTYRATAVTALPSSASAVLTVEISPSASQAVWISGGPGFTEAFPLRFDAEISAKVSRERVLHYFAGRKRPVEISGDALVRAVSVSATLTDDDGDRDLLEEIFTLPGPHLYRDPSGRRFYASVSEVSWGRSPGGDGSVSFTATEADRY